MSYNPTKRVGIYSRVSTEEQVEKGYSIPEQIQECKKRAKELYNECSVFEYVDDGISGEILERPGLENLLEDAKNGHIDIVIALNNDRLSRNTAIYAYVINEFNKYNVDLQYVNIKRENSPEGQFIDLILSATAEYDKKKILFNMSRGRRSKARQGKILRDYNIYGYYYDRENHNLKVNENEAQVVYEIWERYCFYNESINSIAKDLTRRRISTKTGKKIWHRQVVRQILLQTAYTGTFYANKWNTEGVKVSKLKRDTSERITMKKRDKNDWIPISCPNIVPKQWRQIVDSKLKNSRKKYGKNNAGKYLCSGIIKCGNCGVNMYGSKAKDWGRTVYVYYCKNNWSGAKNRCGRRIYMEKINNEVWKYIKNILYEPKIIIDKINEESNSIFEKQKKELAELEKSLKRINKNKTKLINFLKETDDKDIAEEIIKEKEKENEIKTQIEDVKRNIYYKEKENRKGRRVNSYRNIIQNYIEKEPEKLSSKERNSLARLLVKKVVVYGNYKVEIYGY
ncbi:recombinase family protein [Natranaerofaba carboxydovora]|uniref:recombinase family protein n=1 Tax=Natranaerofaba carboxydovora TaxID=2742683 RepID=UPI001F145C0E|nr:recombinase family protein [Natranaerofaba carboxydovora]UMZ73994.1 hypothetical protein ACONDI_01564 [Natranaerofaba carboxydovora]